MDSTGKQKTAKINEKVENYKVESIAEEQVRRQLVKLKNRKTAGKDKIRKEAWLKAPDNVIRRMTEWG